MNKEISNTRNKAATYNDVVANKRITVIDFVRMLPGVNTNRTLHDLVEAGYLYKGDKGYRVHSQYLNTHFKECIDGKYGQKIPYVLGQVKEALIKLYAMAEGKEVICKMYFDRELTMIKGRDWFAFRDQEDARRITTMAL